MRNNAQIQEAKPDSSRPVGLRRNILQRRTTALLEPDDAKQTTAPVDSRLGHHFGRVSVLSPARTPLQPKLRISQPNDSYEQEADRAADHVMRSAEPEKEEGEEKVVQTKPLAITPFVQRQSAELSEEEKQKGEKETIQAKREIGGTNGEWQINAIREDGLPLPSSVRSFFEPRFGHDFSKVRIHHDGHAAESAKAVKAHAFTAGQHVVFGAGQYAPTTSRGQRLLAHELTHVVQQERAGTRVQRYEAGEHAELGETREELKKALAPATYPVQKDDTLLSIAEKFRITVAELKEANKAKLKRWPATDGNGRTIEGFDAGEIIAIPQRLSDFAKAAVTDKSAKFTVNGVVMDYGVGIAMGDFFESPEQMAKASPEELKTLAALIQRERSGKPVSTEEWVKATGGRYLKLAEKNEAHFAPPKAATPSSAVTTNHKSAWETHHKTALDASKAGDKDKALLTNAYGDHFLTDAFSSGHLMNKREVMEQFKSQLKLDAKGKEFTGTSKKFFDEVAADAFTGSVKSEFSKYETYESYAAGWHPNIDSVSAFSALLQGIHKEEPNLHANAVAKGVHDRLNAVPGGLPVENAVGDSWMLSGDGTLNDKTKEIARKAVAQSQLNVTSVYKTTSEIGYSALYKKVWDYTPQPSADGVNQMAKELRKGADIASPELKKAVVKLVQDNYKMIIDELVKRKKLRKA